MPRSERIAYNIRSALTTEQINDELNAIDALLQRQGWLDEEALERRHHLLLALPSHAEEVMTARARIAARIAERSQRRRQPQQMGLELTIFCSCTESVTG